MSYKATKPGLAVWHILACFIVLLFISAPFYVSNQKLLLLVTNFLLLLKTRSDPVRPERIKEEGYYLRAVGRKVLWSSACVCAHCFCPQDISRTGSWITTKIGGWEQGVNL